MSLSVANISKINQASRQSIRLIVARLAPFFEQSRWLGPRNRYASDVVSKIKEDNANNSLNAKQLAQYIAASGFLHLVDGWSYLGRSVQSLLRGDPHRAIHLAYYGELRAAMSILATEGIGVFNRNHFVVTGLNSVVPIAGQIHTHQF